MLLSDWALIFFVHIRERPSFIRSPLRKVGGSSNSAWTDTEYVSAVFLYLKIKQLIRKSLTIIPFVDKWILKEASTMFSYSKRPHALLSVYILQRFLYSRCHQCSLCLIQMIFICIKACNSDLYKNSSEWSQSHFYNTLER